jgi:hypothetical protein
MPAETIDRLLNELHSLRVTLERLRVTLGTLGRVAEDHETRVRALEGRQQRLTPVVSALTFVLGVLATQVIGRLL